ncbi:hypothetical protein BGZ80_001896 [Entomortierella chlamydospora]|uniref:Uncharacterized protein n=1 Tax=Entomortierella chlamydospora TaxID=101097 RepID=A0A9P6T3B3_9FUNG|nr:hypothetical protein BGZ80_001896 [Entomortierella chlamydospora]
MLISRVVIGVQFKKREEMMLREVEEYHIRLKGPPQDSDQDFDLNTASNTRDQSIHEAQASAQTLCTAVSSPQSSTLELAQPNHAGHSVDTTKNSHVKKGDDLTETSPGDLDTHNTSYRRRVAKKSQRPTTIIGQVRSSIFGGISSSGSRPKSVPVFDIDRYEKEILGLGYEQNKHRLYREDLDEFQVHDIFQSECARQENEAEGSGHGSYGDGHEFPISFDSVLPDTFDLNGGYATRRATAVNRCTLTRTQLEEEQREAKYREIVKALRRASSVATGKYPNQTLSGVNNLDMTANPSQDRQRRVSSRDAGGESSAAGFVPRRPELGATSQATKAQFRKSLPALLNPTPLSYKTNPYLFHQPSISDVLSNISSSSSNRSNYGFPSLPMLLIHRELAVAAKEKNRIQNLYYNPVLREAKARAIVWLPSQTERSFWGTHGNEGTEHCKYHAELRQNKAAAPSATDTTESVEDLSSFGLSTSTLAPAEQAHPNGLASYHRGKHQCTCRLYQQVTQAVADAVALADQEIRDLRIVGLTVWLDSRHVIWGQVNEEDGRLGDRVMISTVPHQFVSGSTVKSNIQKQVGDGLLSWLEAEELEDGEDGEIHNDRLRQIGQGAPGIIGGSVGLVMKRPIGSYGKLVGDGEEDNISREC